MVYSEKQRQAKIAEYLKRRLARTLVKKVLYDCRKTFADSRPRVGGRFVKISKI